MSFKAVLFNQEPDNAFGVIAPKFLVTQHSPLPLYKILATRRDLVQHDIHLQDTSFRSFTIQCFSFNFLCKLDT